MTAVMPVGSVSAPASQPLMMKASIKENRREDGQGTIMVVVVLLYDHGARHIDFLSFDYNLLKMNDLGNLDDFERRLALRLVGILDLGNLRLLVKSQVGLVVENLNVIIPMG